MQKDQEDGRWHLDKKVPISIIVVIAMQGIAGLWVIADIKKDVEILKTQFTQQQLRDERQDRTAEAAVLMVRNDLQEVSRKLDRLLERATHKP